MSDTAPTVTITDASFDQDVIASTTPILVDFWAEWCGPCKQVAPILDEIAREQQGKLIIGKLDIEANPQATRDFKVMSIPTMILFQDGKPVKQIVGKQSKAALLAELGDVVS